MPNFICPFSVGFYLKRRYHKSRILNLQEEELNNGNFKLHLEALKISQNELLYLENSPNYCYNNDTIGVPGTLDRTCVRPRKGQKMPKWHRRSCRRLCTQCGLVVKKREIVIETSCNCHFHYGVVKSGVRTVSEH